MWRWQFYKGFIKTVFEYMAVGIAVLRHNCCQCSWRTLSLTCEPWHWMGSSVSASVAESRVTSFSCWQNHHLLLVPWEPRFFYFSSLISNPFLYSSITSFLYMEWWLPKVSFHLLWTSSLLLPSKFLHYYFNFTPLFIFSGLLHRRRAESTTKCSSLTHHEAHQVFLSLFCWFIC